MMAFGLQLYVKIGDKCLDRFQWCHAKGFEMSELSSINTENAVVHAKKIVHNHKYESENVLGVVT